MMRIFTCAMQCWMAIYEPCILHIKTGVLASCLVLHSIEWRFFFSFLLLLNNLGGLVNLGFLAS